LQVLEVNQGEGRELTRCKVDPEEATFDEARLSRSGQQAGSWVIKELKLDGKIEVEEPYTRKMKVITRALVKRNNYPP